MKRLTGKTMIGWKLVRAILTPPLFLAALAVTVAGIITAVAWLAVAATIAEAVKAFVALALWVAWSVKVYRELD